MMKVDFMEMYWDEEIIDRVEKVLKSGRYVKGSEINRLENNLSGFCGTDYGIGFNSGTSALLAAYYSAGISSEDEVIVPSFSFMATVSPLLFLNARPKFVEIDEETFTIDPEDVKEKVSDKTKAIVPVHLYGHPADMKPLIDIAEDNELFLIEDASQAHGAEYEKKKVGRFGEIACFSFYPSKNMTVSGEGGMAVTDDKELAEKMRKFRDHGRGEDDKYLHRMEGLNLRMSETLAAVGNCQFEKLEDWNVKRRSNAHLYDEFLSEEIRTPVEKDWARHVYHLYVFRSQNRDQLKDFLSENNIGTGIHYPVPIHEQPVVKEKLGSSKLPISERVSGEVLSLPMYPNLEKEKIKYVADKVNEFEVENR